MLVCWSVNCSHRNLFRKVLGICQLCSKCFKNICERVKLLVKVQAVEVQFNKKNTQIFFKNSDLKRNNCENTEELF